MTLATLALLLVAASEEGPAAAPPAPAPGPGAVVERALAEAKEKGRPALLEFTLASSGWCREMDREVGSDPEVAAFRAAHFAQARVESGTPEADALEKAWEVDGFPTFVFVAPNGTEADRHVGSLSKEDFLALLEDQRAGNTFAALPARIEKAPEDAGLRASYGRRLLDRNLVDEARRELEKAAALDPEDRLRSTPGARLRLALIAAQEERSPKPVLAFLEKYADTPAGLEAQRQMVRHHLRKKDLGAALDRMEILDAKGALGLRQRCQYATLLAMERKDGKRALAVAEECAKRDPEDVRPVMARAFALAALGRLEEAVATARAAVDRAPEELKEEGNQMVRQIEDLLEEAKGKQEEVGR